MVRPDRFICSCGYMAYRWGLFAGAGIMSLYLENLHLIGSEASFQGVWSANWQDRELPTG